MYDELVSLLSILLAVFFSTYSLLLVFCVGKKKPSGKPRSPAPSTTTKSPAPGVPTFNHGVCAMCEGKPDPKESAMTISKVEPESQEKVATEEKKAGEEKPAVKEKEEDGKADAKKHTKTTSEVGPEDSKSRENVAIEEKKAGKAKPPAKETKEEDRKANANVKAKKPEKMKYVSVGINEAQADLAVKLLQQASQENKDSSVIMSPVSIAVVLAMVYAGAKAETKMQLGKLIANANRVYVQHDFTVLDTFKADIKRHYGGMFQQVDFKERLKAAKEINDFVEEKTHQKIKDIIKPEALNGPTSMVLVNAIYVKGAWKEKFDNAKTKKKIFHVSDGEEAEVDMMHMTSELIHFDDEDAQVLGLPYEGEDLFMFVILPRKRYDLLNVLGSLNGKKLAKYLAKRDKCDVNVQLPRFKTETSLALKKTLTALGLADAFIAEKANFEGIAKEPTYIHAVLHKAFVETNEEGTEAAAATEAEDVLIGGWCPDSEREKPREFVADHPFLYVITNRSGVVLFFGSMLKT